MTTSRHLLLVPEASYISGPRLARGVEGGGAPFVHNLNEILYIYLNNHKNPLSFIVKSRGFGGGTPPRTSYPSPNYSWGRGLVGRLVNIT